MSPTLEAVLLSTMGAALLIGFGYLVRREMGAVSAMQALMTQRGFATEPAPPRVESGAIKLEPRFGWRGTLATGQPVLLCAGRGFGEQLGPETRMTSTGHYFYVWARLTEPLAAQPPWRAQWKGEARALAQSDGSTVVYWQRDYIAPNLAKSLDELEAALRSGVPG